VLWSDVICKIVIVTVVISLMSYVVMDS